nr:ABC transporter ATP-binding protein [Xaviernesmea rhizosphaerae]
MKSYDGKTAVVKGIDLSVAAGEFLTILGPSGSGKTSLLMMLAGFELPSSGEIRFGDSDVSRLPPHKRNIGMVFQHYALFPHMTVGQNLAFPLQVRGYDQVEIARRVAWALELVRLAGVESRRPAQLSGGQQQRIAVARALIFRPELVLMDEPLGALDKQLREQMQEEIARLHRDLRPTVIYVTHDQSEAIALSDRVAVFDSGRISQIAPPRELYEAPASAFVATFIGENNRIPAKAVDLCPFARFVIPGDRFVSAVPIGIETKGADCCVMVRPERLHFLACQQELANSIDAVVTGVTYHGDSIRIRAEITGSTTELISRQANDGQRPVPRIGEPILLGWRTEDARAFPNTAHQHSANT